MRISMISYAEISTHPRLKTGPAYMDVTFSFWGDSWPSIPEISKILQHPLYASLRNANFREALEADGTCVSIEMDLQVHEPNGQGQLHDFLIAVAQFMHSHGCVFRIVKIDLTGLSDVFKPVFLNNLVTDIKSIHPKRIVTKMFAVFETIPGVTPGLISTHPTLERATEEREHLASQQPFSQYVVKEVVMQNDNEDTGDAD